MLISTVIFNFIGENVENCVQLFVQFVFSFVSFVQKENVFFRQNAENRFCPSFRCKEKNFSAIIYA